MKRILSTKRKEEGAKYNSTAGYSPSSPSYEDNEFSSNHREYYQEKSDDKDYIFTYDKRTEVEHR